MTPSRIYAHVGYGKRSQAGTRHSGCLLPAILFAVGFLARIADRSEELTIRSLSRFLARTPGSAVSRASISARRTEHRSVCDLGKDPAGRLVCRDPDRHGTACVKAVAMANRIEPLFDEPALDFLDLVAPLVARQERVEAVEHLGGVPLLPCHAINTEERQVPADPTVALLEEELDDRVETDQYRMRDESQQPRRKPVPLPERDEIAGEVGHSPFRP